jgi:hypothetical protein
MRAADRAEIELCGLVPRHALTQLWRESIEPKAAIVDGEVAAAWGDAAPTLSYEGYVWLFTAPPIERIPFAFYRETRQIIARYLQVRRSLLAHVACDYERSIRFFAMLGFKVGEPVGMYRELRIERT